ncbi:WD40/YVTN/BNR-like repeat-containing protein [Natrinema sp. 74]|uniref:WD40/YVTN/BNR-like repeat-containing protein n=1 Tax=Natrinema sp. 74 TaxID=3384159 RepID=UPI0038D4A903
MWELGPDADEPEWQSVETPFPTDLFEVVSTVAGPYAIGDGGVIVADRGDGWEVIIEDGPNVRSNQLRGLDVTDDGRRIWFAGSSGAIGCYDIETRRKFDYSYPKEMTSTWEGLAVSGETGDEKLLVANGSGEILPVTIHGFDVNWGVTSKPNEQGSKVAALAASPDGYGYAVDTSGNAYKTTKDDGWVDIGIVNSQVKFYDIWAGENERVYVAAGDGRVYRYDDSYQGWTPIRVGEKSLRAFDTYGDQLVALGDAGAFYQRIDGGERWEQRHTPTESVLNDVALGTPDVAVGKSGLVIERPRGEPRDARTSADGDTFDGRGESYDPSDADTESQGAESSDGSSAGSPDGSSESSSPSSDSPSESNSSDSAND